MEKSKTPATVTTVATINNKKIVVIKNGEEIVAVKPICEALGIDFDWQNKRIKEDEILGQLHKISYATGSDGKRYEMVTIPFKFVFGWLFSVNTKKVAPEAREKMIKYKLECYNALYDHFTAYAEFVEEKQQKIDEKLEELLAVKYDFNSAKTRLKTAEKELEEIRHISFDDYKMNKSQLSLEFNGEGGTA